MPAEHGGTPYNPTNLRPPISPNGQDHAARAKRFEDGVRKWLSAETILRKSYNPQGITGEAEGQGVGQLSEAQRLLRAYLGNPNSVAALSQSEMFAVEGARPVVQITTTLGRAGERIARLPRQQQEELAFRLIGSLAKDPDGQRREAIKNLLTQVPLERVAADSLQKQYLYALTKASEAETPEQHAILHDLLDANNIISDYLPRDPEARNTFEKARRSVARKVWGWSAGSAKINRVVTEPSPKPELSAEDTEKRQQAIYADYSDNISLMKISTHHQVTPNELRNIISEGLQSGAIVDRQNNAKQEPQNVKYSPEEAQAITHFNRTVSEHFPGKNPVGDEIPQEVMESRIVALAALLQNGKSVREIAGILRTNKTVIQQDIDRLNASASLPDPSTDTPSNEELVQPPEENIPPEIQGIMDSWDSYTGYSRGRKRDFGPQSTEHRENIGESRRRSKWSEEQVFAFGAGATDIPAEDKHYQEASSVVFEIDGYATRPDEMAYEELEGNEYTL